MFAYIRFVPNALGIFMIRCVATSVLRSKPRVEITGANVLKKGLYWDKHARSLSRYLKTSKIILDLVDDVLIGDPAHVEVALERRITVFPSFIIDQLFKLVTRTDLLLSNGSVACFKSNTIWSLRVAEEILVDHLYFPHRLDHQDPLDFSRQENEFG